MTHKTRKIEGHWVVLGTRCVCDLCLLLHAVTEATERAEKAEAALDRVRALCDVSEWLNAEAEYWYGEWCAGRPAPAMNNGWGLGPRLSRSALGRVRAAIDGSEA